MLIHLGGVDLLIVLAGIELLISLYYVSRIDQEAGRSPREVRDESSKAAQSDLP